MVNFWLSDFHESKRAARLETAEMAQAEVVTVRMSRGNLETPWGFDIVPPLTISNVVGGSLADRAGLLNGDALVELEGHENLDLTLARQLLSKAQHKVELVVHRYICKKRLLSGTAVAYCY
ncbi:unnamed protein product [Toxocara canis]|uniref:PDZ domain-containing protein n=1 Tax=Toxocara canis TaxID=6265 RepID=A0A183TVM4_TOXCA|nr:unnamed protein product [Toxocara canis]